MLNAVTKYDEGSYKIPNETFNKKVGEKHDTFVWRPLAARWTTGTLRYILPWTSNASTLYIQPYADYLSNVDDYHLLCNIFILHKHHVLFHSGYNEWQADIIINLSGLDSMDTCLHAIYNLKLQSRTVDMQKVNKRKNRSCEMKNNWHYDK